MAKGLILVKKQLTLHVALHSLFSFSFVELEGEGGVAEAVAGSVRRDLRDHLIQPLPEAV